MNVHKISHFESFSTDVLLLFFKRVTGATADLNASLLCSIVVLLVLNSPSLPAADSTFVLMRDAGSAWGDAERLSYRIGHMTSSSALSLGLGCAAVVSADAALIYTGTDQHLREGMTTGHSTSKDQAMDWANFYGTGGAALAICGGVYVGGLMASDEGLRTTARLTVESLIIGGVCTTILKSAVGRSRPYTNRGADFFRPFDFKDESYSWPSGHSTVAFCVSSTLARRCDNIFASIGLYAVAGATASARMYYDKHWLSDVLTGAVIGIASSSLVNSLHEEGIEQRAEGVQKKTTQLYLIPTPNGLSMSYLF